MRSHGDFMRERLRGPYSSEDEALVAAWRWAGVAPEHQEYPPLWAVLALDVRVRGLDRREG